MRFVTWILIIVLLAGGVWAVAGRKDAIPETPVVVEEQGRARQEIRAQVLAFGERLKNVSLLSPGAAADIEREYGPYVTRGLLASWTAQPQRALGRDTSSPWPERIDIIEIERSGEAYEVHGTLVYQTSADRESRGNAGTADLALIVRQEDGAWKIDAATVLRQHAPNTPQAQPALE